MTYINDHYNQTSQSQLTDPSNFPFYFYFFSFHLTLKVNYLAKSIKDEADYLPDLHKNSIFTASHINVIVMSNESNEKAYYFQWKIGNTGM